MFAAALFWITVSYILFLTVGYLGLIRVLTRNRHTRRTDEIPEITVLIPAYNEEKNLPEKVDNLRAAAYPADKMDVVVVDNESTDRTAEVAQSLGVRVLSSRRGKMNALNEGLSKAETDIVVITDADALLAEDAITNLVSCFASDEIGAVGGWVVVRGAGFFYRSKADYHRTDWTLRTLEGRLDTTVSLDGKLMALRRSVLRQLPREATVDDIEVTLSLREKGYRAIIDDKAIVYEHAPHGLREEIRQVRRRVACSIYVQFRYATMLFNPRYSWFGMLIFPTRRFFAVFLPFFLIYTLIYLFLWNQQATAVAVGLAIAFVVATGQYYPLIQSLGIILGWVDVLLGRVRPEAAWDKLTDQ